MSKTVFEEIKELWNQSSYSSKHPEYWDIYKHIFVDMIESKILEFWK